MSSKPFIHQSSFVDKGVVVGQGTKIWHFSHVMKGAGIGKDCTLGQNVFIGENVKVGDRVKIQNNVSVYDGVALEDDVFCGPSVVFTNVKSPRSELPVNKNYQQTIIKKGATLGANATIVCGVTIGKYALVGAGAVVTKDVPNYGLVFGNPAEPKGFVCRCGQKLEFKNSKSSCHSCQSSYRKAGPKKVTPDNE